MNDENLLDKSSLSRASKIPYRLIDFYEWVCTGDRPNGGDYYLGFMNNEEWQLQIYSGRHQVNFCRKESDGMYIPAAGMLFDPDYGDVRMVKVDSHGRADYDHVVPYAETIEVDRVNWTTALGVIGPTIKEAIELIMVNR